ncbi:MAG: flagellin lysine-N-methylase [Ruminococcus sp.]|nr:flagellin lysine-N-methylase [Ruminococcus sp.]
MNIYPNYYKEFKCIAGKCKHNCCIGWEIDIDEDTLGFYNCVEGEFGKTLKDNINYCDIPHFKLGKNERCPFLNENNLCEIIINLGEDALCDICTQHPRFHNELPDRVESGLGLCCEEAARLILSQREKTTLVGNSNTNDKIILLRDKVIDALQNRTKGINKRIDDMLSLCKTSLVERPIKSYCDLLISLETLDEKWEELLLSLKEKASNIDYASFESHISGREFEYEQFLVYLIYRHFANSPNLEEAQKRARFTAFSYTLLYYLGALTYHTKGEFNFEDQVELTRLFSSEIEYSDENLYTLFDVL